MDEEKDLLNINLEEASDLYLDFTGHLLDDKKKKKVKKEIKDRFLYDDEKVIICMESFEGALYQPKVIITDIRVIYYVPKLFSRYVMRFMNYEDIDTILYNAGPTGGGISMNDKMKKTLQADNFHKDWAEKIALYVGVKRNRHRENPI